MRETTTCLNWMNCRVLVRSQPPTSYFTSKLLAVTHRRARSSFSCTAQLMVSPKRIEKETGSFTAQLLDPPKIFEKKTGSFTAQLLVPPKRIEKETGTVVFAPPILRCGWFLGPHFYQHLGPASPDTDLFQLNVKINYTFF
jgi:hypothetical protein